MENPKFSPVFYLTDLITAYFAAVGMMAALLRRATEGGSYHVKVSLARSAMWAQKLGYINEDDFKQAPENDNYPVNLITEETPYLTSEINLIKSQFINQLQKKIQLDAGSCLPIPGAETIFSRLASLLHCDIAIATGCWKA